MLAAPKLETGLKPNGTSLAAWFQKHLRGNWHWAFPAWSSARVSLGIIPENLRVGGSIPPLATTNILVFRGLTVTSGFSAKVVVTDLWSSCRRR